MHWSHFRIFLLSLLTLFAIGIPACSSGQTITAGATTPALIPLPREIHAGAFIPLIDGVHVSIPGGDAEDKFAADDLGRFLTADGVLKSSHPSAFHIALLRQRSAEAAKVLAEKKQDFDSTMSDEGYVLIIRGHEACVIGASSSGVFYGVQTLKQLVTGRGLSAKIQSAVIRDWPAMKYRGIDDDLSRGPFPTLAFQEHQIQSFAAMKINIYSPYFEHTLAYSANPLPGPPGSSMSHSEVAELVKYARQYHVTIVPEQEAFGHLHHALLYEQYAALAETPHGTVLAPDQPGSIDLIKSWFGEIAAEFPGPFLHIGADETFDLGMGQTKDEVHKRGLGPVYADFLSKIDEALKPLHRKLLFWGDVATSDPSLVKYLPKDMIAIPWVYWHQKNYDSDVQPFKQQGIETWVAPGDANWGLVYPDTDVAFDNIQGFVRDGQRLGSTGVLTTVWNDDGEGLFNLDWYGVMFGAAAGWQLGESNIDDYKKHFGEAFFGDTSGKIDEALQELQNSYDILNKAHVGAVSDGLFWMDPWSVSGQQMASKMRLVNHEVRLHAEHALVLLHQVRAENQNLREPDALDGIEMGARRIDFAVEKFQLSDEMAEAYANAYEHQKDKSQRMATSNLLSSISQTNGRCQDLRDGYSMLKNLYKQVWLSENRPYWLDNVLVQYDLQMQKWQNRADQIAQAHDQWANTYTLPPASQLGIPPVP
jgi:hexosaminidase